MGDETGWAKGRPKNRQGAHGTQSGTTTDRKAFMKALYPDISKERERLEAATSKIAKYRKEN